MRGAESVLARICDSICASVFSRKCAVCQTRICSGALCDACTGQFVQAMEHDGLCTALCGGSVPLYSLLAYRKADKDAAARFLIARKQRLNPAAEMFLARQLEPLCRAVTAEYGTDADWVLTYPPRTKEKQRQTGYDQSHEMAKRLSALTAIPMIPYVRRASGAGIAQKTLGAAERSENAKNSYYLNRRYQKDICGKSVILIDDIVTTGATLAACASMLLEAGAVRVIALTAAKTVHGGKSV